MTAQIKLKHSGGNGVIIEAPASNPASDKTISLPSTESGVFATKDSANSLQNVTGINGGQLGNRNLVINGAMQVAQRATTYTGADNYNTVDRIKTIHSGLNEDVTSSQHELSSSDTPYSLGFRHSYHIQNGNQSAGAGTGDLLSMQYRIEAQDLAKSGWDYKSTSSYVTLSFWVKSSVAQSFGGFLRTHDGTQLTFPFETGALTADAWTKITRTIPGNASMGFSTDNGTGIEINISQFWGTDYTESGKTLDAWSTYSNSSRLKDFPASTWYTTNDATFEITGLQLEVGSTATDFEHRSFAQELALCQRYYQTGFAKVYNSNQPINVMSQNFMPEMRAAPTITGEQFESETNAIWSSIEVTTSRACAFYKNGEICQRWKCDAEI